MPDDPSATLSAIRERAQAATPGEWKHCTAEGRGDWSAGSKVFSIERVEADARPGGVGVIDAWADAEFIAMARTAIPALVAALEAVLALAGKWDRVDARLGEIGRDSAPVGDLRREMAFSHAKIFEDCAAALREAITSALTGEPANPSAPAAGTGEGP